MTKSSFVPKNAVIETTKNLYEFFQIKTDSPGIHLPTSGRTTRPHSRQNGGSPGPRTT